MLCSWVELRSSKILSMVAGEVRDLTDYKTFIAVSPTRKTIQTSKKLKDRLQKPIKKSGTDPATSPDASIASAEEIFRASDTSYAIDMSRSRDPAFSPSTDYPRRTELNRSVEDAGKADVSPKASAEGSPRTENVPRRITDASHSGDSDISRVVDLSRTADITEQSLEPTRSLIDTNRSFEPTGRSADATHSRSLVLEPARSPQEKTARSPPPSTYTESLLLGPPELQQPSSNVNSSEEAKGYQHHLTKQNATKKLL
ncbi:unnamed protein product [Gongylonema pulchrum]|uniref:Uncharacterized protein n=1 Tax=Gongylonema pulchrum TaxID=637853 RepID=A0A183CZ41_9BILA|nr:unnamed protein product [Gongylonema pulchrum]